MQESTGITRKKLVQLTGCPIYIYAYLRDLGRLPVMKETTGRGVSTVYFPEAVDVVKSYLNHQAEAGSSETDSEGNGHRAS